MSRELDVRDFRTSRATPARTEALRAAAADVSETLPGTHRVEVEAIDATTGNAAAVVSVAAPAAGDDYIRRALQHVQAVAPAFGLVDQAPEFLADPVVQTTSSGQRARQPPAAIPRHPDLPGRHDRAVRSRTARSSTPSEARWRSRRTRPRRRSFALEDAVARAAKYVATPDADERRAVDQFGEPLRPPKVDLKGFKPKVRAAFTNVPERPTTLDPGPFGAEIKAQPHRGSRAATASTSRGRSSSRCPTTRGSTSPSSTRPRARSSTATRPSRRLRPSGTSTASTAAPPVRRPTSRVRSATTGFRSRRSASKTGAGATSARDSTSPATPARHCPAGGAHDQTGSGNYRLVQNTPSYPGQANWRWCHKCQGLYFAGNPGSNARPAARTTQTGSGDYTLIHQAPLAFGQHGWRWCKKCQGLFFSGERPARNAPRAARTTPRAAETTRSSRSARACPAAFPDTWVDREPGDRQLDVRPSRDAPARRSRDDVERRRDLRSRRRDR